MNCINLIINLLNVALPGANTARANNRHSVYSSQKLPAFTFFYAVFTKKYLEITCNYFTGGVESGQANYSRHSFIPLAEIIKCGQYSDIKNFIGKFA